MRYIASSLLLFCSLANAGGGATGGSTEFTQRMNNSELIVNVKNTANMVTEARKQVEEARKMVMDSQRNLTTLPAEFRWIEDIATTASEGYRLYSTLERAKTDIGNIDDFFHRKAQQLNCENKRMDRCLRNWANNVERLKSERTSEVRMIETSIRSGEKNLKLLEDLAKRGQEGGGGNVEQLNLLQQQIAALGANLYQMQVALEDEKMANHQKRVGEENSAMSIKIQKAIDYKAKIDNVNKQKRFLGLDEIDTSTDDLYNTDISAMRDYMTSGSSE